MINFPFETMKSYRIIDHLYNERKDFIILGLCGRVGSGVSTVSSILEKSFDDLQLPQPGFENTDQFTAHEYNILYTYAKKNWLPFYKIRTSALITRQILNSDAKKFAEFLKNLYDKNENSCVEESFAQIADEFFEKEMVCDWKIYYKYHDESEIANIISPWKLFESDLPFTELNIYAKNEEELDMNDQYVYKSIDVDSSLSIDFKYDNESKTIIIKNKDMSKLLNEYIKRRNNKSGFENPFWYLILKQYLYDFLPHEASVMWNEVRKLSQSLPTIALQYLGNNLRINKQPYYDDEELRKDAYVYIAEEINVAIKVLRAYQLILQNQNHNEDDVRTQLPNHQMPEVRTVIVIDSIKNPYESLYLKTRYNNYYLIGVYTENTERRKRLRELEHFVDDDIKAIDIIEENTEFKKAIKKCIELLDSDGKIKDENHLLPIIIVKMYEQFKNMELMENLPYVSPFIMQNVSSCLDSADILINNVTDNNAYTYLKKTLLRYVCLIMNPGIVLPTSVERCMQIAYTAKVNSGCISRQVGAVITDNEYHLLSVGWNQQPEGQIPCSYRNLCELHHHWVTESYSDYESDDRDSFQEKIKNQVECFFDTNNSPFKHKGKLPNYCFKDYQNSINKERNQVHTRALHAEETAFLNLSANTDRAVNGILFTTSSPCELCAKKAMYMGISTIYFVEVYAGVSQKHVLNIGDKRPNMILFTGAIGTAYTKLFTPLLPAKDENEMWLGEKMNIDLYEKLKNKSST